MGGGYTWELTLKLLGLVRENTDQLCENNVLKGFSGPQNTGTASMDSSEF